MILIFPQNKKVQQNLLNPEGFKGVNFTLNTSKIKRKKTFDRIRIWSINVSRSPLVYICMLDYFEPHLFVPATAV